tara:strand:+ start:58 stop:207 length:150 start_codon:yes stop_codon:yes gene_type:complete
MSSATNITILGFDGSPVADPTNEKIKADERGRKSNNLLTTISKKLHPLL